jgi:hypothetical protein
MSINRFQQEKLDQALKSKPYLKALHDRLLELGGSVPVIWNPGHTTEENFMHLLLMLGRVSSGRGARLRVMARNGCHANAEALAKRYPRKYQAETGFALSDDGCWREHSWAFDTTKNQIVETTELRKRYYGIIEPNQGGNNG